MDAATLARSMGCSQDVAARHLTGMNAAMGRAGCTTVNRAAMWCAQIGHESLGLKYMEEIADGSAYEGRKDLGNTKTGDGKRFKGRGPIQLTGRHNYGLFGQWCQRQGLVTDPGYFLANPDVVATSQWGFLAAAWYWTVARPRLNEQADAADITAATRSINGGTNGIADRKARWERCRALGTAILPAAAGPATATGPDTLPRLTFGMRGHPGVKALQAWSNAYPWKPPLPVIPASGNYLDQTRDLVRAIQARVGVTGPDATGDDVGPRTNAGLWRLGFRG